MRSAVEALRPFDARLIKPPGKSSLRDDPQEIKLLVEKATQRDTDSFGDLYDKYFTRIYSHLYYRVSNVQDAEDMTAQVFLNAWKAMPRYKDTGRPFVVWLLSIAHNLVVDHYRAKRETTSADDIILPADDASNPVAILEANFEKAGLRGAIGKLKKPDQQLVVVMRYIDGMEYPEIAAVLNKSEGAVRVILHRALLNLRGIMEIKKVPVLPKKENKADEQSTEKRFSYDDLVRISGMNKSTLTAKILTVEKRGRLKLSTRSRSGKRFTREDAAAVLTYLGKDPSLAARL